MSDLIISALLTRCFDPGDSAYKIGKPGTRIDSFTVDQFADYISPWYSTLKGPAVVLYDDVPQELIERCSKVQWVKYDHDGSEMAWVTRYRMLEKFLAERTDIDRIFWTDINDVAHAVDFFAWLDSWDIQPQLVFGEDHCKFGGDWFVHHRSALPPYIREWYFRVPEGLVLAAGLWGGPRELALSLVKALNEHFDRYEERSRPQISWDMALLSYVAYGMLDRFATFKIHALQLPHSHAGLTLRSKLPNPVEHCGIGSRVLAEGDFKPTHGPPLIWHQVQGMFEVENFGRIYREAVNRVVEPATFVEVGSWLGRSTSYMAQEIRRSKKPVKFYAVDTWKGTPNEPALMEVVRANGGSIFNLWQQNMVRTGSASYVEPIEADSAEAAQQFADGSVDFGFFDDDHTYEGCKRTLQAWKSKLKPGGWYAGHDFDLDGVRRAVTEEFPKVRQWENCWIVD